MNASKITGTAIAAAAAALFIGGCTHHTGTTSAAVAPAGSAQVKCYGANACKGQASCKTAMNACKGQNACKANGFVMATETACLNHVAGRSSIY
jgi:hypothetical protein